MSHIDAPTLELLLEGSLSKTQAQRALAHVAGGCEQCQALLERQGPDLDTLARLVEAEQAAPAAPPADLWSQVEAGLPQPQPVRRGPRLVAWGAALAIAAALILAVLPRVGPDQPSGIKGPGDVVAPSVQLRVVAGRLETGGFELERRVQQGEQVRREHTLLFELSTDQASARYLFVLDGQGQATLLAPTGTAGAQPAGPRRLEEDGQWVALTVDDMVGPLQLVALAGPAVASPQDDLLTTWRQGRLPAGFGVAVLELEIAP